jgi:adenosylmethionine---8-amino-7-oxononanoate aminotransferase
VNNQLLLDRSLRAVWHPCTQMKAHENLPLVPISRGDGVWLHDFDGHRYLDAVSSWWVNLFGHNNPRINDAIIAQLGKLEHVMLAGFTHEPAVRLSEQLSALAGGRLGHCFFASDGASATEIALKMSHHYWRNLGRPGKRNFIGLAGGYHGETLGALGVTDITLFRDAYAPLLQQAATVPTPDTRLAAAGESAIDYARRCAGRLAEYLEQHHHETAALIVEPLVQCATGFAMYDPEYLRLAREICDRYEVHLVADEIAVGFGRTGSFFAHEQAGITPDFLCLSKGLSGGYLPLSLVMTRDVIYDAFYSDEETRGFLHSHSYSGNPLACTAALATLAIFAEDDVIAANQRLASHINSLAAPLAGHRRVKHWRNRGMIWAFDVDTNDPQFSRRFFALALQKQLLLRPIGPTVYFMPPYVLDHGNADFLLQQTAAVLDEVLAS